MNELGTWGGDFELVALSEALGIKIYIHTKENPVFLIKSANKSHFNRGVHLAYHIDEHYSSVRNLDDVNDNPAKEIFLTDFVDYDDAGDSEEKDTGKPMNPLKRMILLSKLIFL
jgi:hypothetical protein